MDRLVTKATPEGTLNYTFDAAGHVATIASSNTNGASVSYTYDDLNRLATVVDNRLPSGANTTTYAYDPASNLATATYPNGLQSTFTYDSLNRVTALDTPVSGYAYQFDPTGKRTMAVELSGRTLNWSYDGINRLTQETIADAPNNGPTWSQKNKTCLDKINSTPDGKFYNFFSPLSMIPGIGPEWKGSIAEDVGGGLAKLAIFKGMSAAGRNWAGTAVGVVGGEAANAIHVVAEEVLAPVSVAAMAGQLTVHAGCAIGANF